MIRSIFLIISIVLHVIILYVLSINYESPKPPEPFEVTLILSEPEEPDDGRATTFVPPDSCPLPDAIEFTDAI